MKLPSRFFRGELNGNLLYHIVTFLNYYLLEEGFIWEIIYNKIFQWKLPGDSILGYIIREEDIFNIGRVAGVNQIRGDFLGNIGSIWFTGSKIVDGIQRSERGFVDMNFEAFMFHHVGPTDSYPNDDYAHPISTFASLDERMTYVPKEEGVVPLGYIYDGEDAFEPDGTLIPSAIHTNPPPAGQAYIEFFGLTYLYFEEKLLMNLPLSTDVFKLLFETLQYIRRYGPSVESFMTITELLCVEYVYDIDFVTKPMYYQVEYSLNESFDILHRERRYTVWKNVCAYKFKYIHLVNRA